MYLDACQVLEWRHLNGAEIRLIDGATYDILS